ncbi:lipoprotein-releasing ABC transporter permease subunit [Agaribacter marinus]|uniref:Transporter n=1 Tax=Agaribacter marinus TaxID=1431249 RepID=A0AA37SW51_9ALTE|nr:lipoprotein-releasing ABC transporter permease subunit [Agaribacter marinus]GLR70177.1 transporter [Agaribacter marinus]
MLLPQFIALRYARAGSKRSFVAFINRFSILGITLGIAALIIVLSVMNGLEAQLKSRILGILPHVVASASPNQVSGLNFDDERVLSTASYLEQEVVVQSRTHVKGVILQGVDTEKNAAYSMIAQSMRQGSYDSLGAGEFNLVLSQTLANQLSVSVGQKVRLISPQTSVHSPFGKLPSQRLFTVTGIFNVASEMDDKVVVVHWHDAAKLMRKKPEIIATTRLFLQDPFEYEKIVRTLRNANIDFTLWRERQGALFDAVKMEKNMMTLMLTLVILVAGFNVVSALVMVVAEKRADIAILQTQGMLPRQITQVFVLNGIFNGCVGVVGGVILGLGGVYLLNPLLDLMNFGLAFGDNGQSLPIDVRWLQVTLILSCTILLCGLASLYPAKMAAAIKPANGLRTA